MPAENRILDLICCPRLDEDYFNPDCVYDKWSFIKIIIIVIFYDFSVYSDYFHMDSVFCLHLGKCTECSNTLRNIKIMLQDHLDTSLSWTRWGKGDSRKLDVS